ASAGACKRAGASLGAERFEHEHPLRLAVHARAQQVAAVGRPELPRELELHEQVQALGHRCTVSFTHASAKPARCGDLNRRRQMSMSDSGNVAKSLRDRLSDSTEERLGKALSDLLENP